MQSLIPKKRIEPFFCSAAAQRASEDLSGTAGHYQTYVLIECPLPWSAKAFDSPAIPSALRRYVKAVSADKSVRFLCINRGVNDPARQTTVLIYERAGQSAVLPHHPTSLAGDSFAHSHFTSGYSGYEFHLDSLDQVTSCLEAYWQNRQNQAFSHSSHCLLGQKIARQDILICTHGMRDKCCAKLGQPIFRGARQMVEKGILPNVCVWKASHIGGHRFAPTVIALPHGRYYGRLSLSALQAIVTRQGAIAQLHPVYRGWGLLPQPLQLLEQSLLLQHGWSWLDHSVAYQQICSDTCSDASSQEITGKLLVRQTDGKVDLYRARFIRDNSKTYCGKTSCRDASPSTVWKYSIAEYSTNPDLQRDDFQN